MKYIIITIFILPLCTAIFNSKDLIDLINTNNSTWHAGLNFPEETTIDNLKWLNGARGIHPDPNYKLEVKKHLISRAAIPETFDAREKWSYCNKTINNIRNQGGCGSCWAFASTEVMSDRLCIQKEGAVQFEFSPEEIVTCCPVCGDCTGGYVAYAWGYWISEGVVSGGDYNTSRGCKPYSESAFTSGIKQSCSSSCTNNNYKTRYTNDKRFGKIVYAVENNEQQIQTEIMTNGPVGALYTVYQDFYLYQKGVYQPVEETYVGVHAIKIIGWGAENGVPYWLVANSWGTEWGQLNGYFKILRGSNVCGIEQNVFAGEASSSLYLLASQFLIVFSFYFTISITYY